MRRLIMWNLMSVDGFFEGSSPWELSFHETVWGKELEELSIRQLRSADCLLFGRRTYEGMATHWQSAQGEIAELMNAIPKFVCSRSLDTAEWNNTRLMRNAVEGVESLKREGNRNVFLFGSADLSRTLIEHGLFDEYRICVAPVLLGTGRPLFQGEAERLALQLQENTTLANGGLVLRYIPKA